MALIRGLNRQEKQGGKASWSSRGLPYNCTFVQYVSPMLIFAAKSNSPALDELLRRTPTIWRGYSTAATPSVATGRVALDRLLPGGGWPVGALTELIPHGAGIGELRLLIPALRRIACDEGRPVSALVRPPHIPYAPALVQAGLPLHRLIWLVPPSEEEAQWAAEQTLRAGIAEAPVLVVDRH